MMLPFLISFFFNPGWQDSFYFLLCLHFEAGTQRQTARALKWPDSALPHLYLK